MRLFSEYIGLRKEIYVLFFSKVVTCMGSMLWSMMTIVLSTKLNFSATQINLWLVIYTVILLPINILGGKIADRFNKKKIIIISDILEVIIYFICFLMPFSVKSMILFLLASTIENISCNSYDVLVADLSSSDDRQRANSLMYLGTNLGMLLSPTIAGFLVKKHINIIFLVSTITTLLSLIIESIYLQDLSVNNDSNNQYEAPQEGEKLITLLIANKPVVGFVLINAVMWIIYSQYSFLTPLELSYVYGDDGSIVYGLVNSINCFTVIACTSLITRLTKKLPDLVRNGGALIFYAIGFMLFVSFIKVKAIVFFAYFVFTIGEILATTSVSTIITKRIPSTHRGRFLSFNSFVYNFVYILLQSKLSSIYETKGSLFAWNMIIGSCFILAFVFIVLLKADKKRYPDLY